MAGPLEPGLLSRLAEEPRRVAIVRTSRIGDFICATPAFRALRAALPEAEITLIGLPFVRDLATRSRSLDHFVEFPGYPGMAEQFFDARRVLEFFALMQARRFDLAIQMNGSGVYSNPFTLMLGAHWTAGYVREEDPPGRLDAAIPWPEEGHQVRRALAMSRFLGAPSRGEHTDFPLLPEDHAAAEALLGGARRPMIGLHPWARDVGKRWPAPRFAEVGAGLQRRYGGTLVLLGTERDVAGAGEVASMLGDHVLNLAGRTTLGSAGAVISRLSTLVTNDSGPAHVAYALRVPSVTLFSETDPAEWGPPAGGPHRVVTAPGDVGSSEWEVQGSGAARMEALSVDRVLAEADGLLSVPPTLAGQAWLWG